jgi:hypothetical protein
MLNQRKSNASFVKGTQRKCGKDINYEDQLKERSNTYSYESHETVIKNISPLNDDDIGLLFYFLFILICALWQIRRKKMIPISGGFFSDTRELYSMCLAPWEVNEINVKNVQVGAFRWPAYRAGYSVAGQVVDPARHQVLVKNSRHRQVQWQAFQPWKTMDVRWRQERWEAFQLTKVQWEALRNGHNDHK